MVITDGHLNVPHGLCAGMYGITYSLYHPQGLANFIKIHKMSGV